MNSVTNPLFESFSTSKLSLSNRIIMAPMTRGFSPDGVPGDDVSAYYRRRAESGVGLIITEGTTIDHHAASQSSSHPAFHGEAATNGWRRIVEAVHSAGGKIAPQLWHVGMMRNAGRPKDDRLPAIGPSGMNMPGKVSGSAMTEQDIEDVISAYAKAAGLAKALAFDAVEIHAAHGYLIDQFFWSGTNERKDKWGGNPTQRARFGVEVVKAVRTAVGSDFPIILRLSQWKQQDFSQRLAETPAEWEAFVTPFVNAGVDIFHCSTRRFWEPEFKGSDLNLAGWTKRMTGLPTITVGSVGLSGESDFVASLGGKATEISNLDVLLEKLARNEFDLVAVGRALLANPDWSSRVRLGQIEALKPFEKAHLSSLV